MTDAFPWDEAPRHLIRDRDGAFSPAYTRRIRAMGIRDHPTAPRSPWQNGHVERLIGSIRRESLDHRWCSTKRSCIAFLRITLLITTRPERISHWTKMLRVFGGRRSSAAAQRYQSSAGSIINTSGFGFWMSTALFAAASESYFAIFPSLWETESVFQKFNALSHRDAQKQI